MTKSLVNIQRLAVCAAVFSVVVILFGVATRLMDAGLGCPDWPGCYGKLVVPDEKTAAAFAAQPLEPVKAWMEMIHRYLASALGVMALMLFVMAYRIRNQHRATFRWATALLVMVMLQGAFGAWTVTLKLWPQVVTAHLLGGLTCLSLLVALVLSCRRYGGVALTVKSTREMRQWLALLSFVLVLQIALGGWTSSNYAGVGCVGFPQCNGEWWPAMDMSEGFHLSQTIGPHYLYGQLHAEARTAIHFVHRLNALLLGLVIVLAGWRAAKLQSAARRPLLLALVAFCLQLLLGVMLVTQGMPLWVALAHTAGAVALLLLLWWAWHLSGQWQMQTHPELVKGGVQYE